MLNRTLLFLSAITSLGFLMSKAPADEPLIIAHRGASGDAPENTMAAFNLAWEQGADGIEGDFYLTKDGKIVSIHDKDTKKTTGGKTNLVVAESTLAELQALDVGSWKDPKYADERMPTLDQVIDSLPDKKLFFIEIKCGTEIMPALVEAVKRAEKNKPGISSQFSIISFNPDVIKASRKQLPYLTANWLSGFRQNKETKDWEPDSESIISSLQACNASGVGVKANPEAVTEDLVKQLREKGLGFHCWTVNEPDLAFHFRKLGVDSITTDYPQKIREALKEVPEPKANR